MLDERLVTALHVETLRQDQVHAEHEPHVLFQASTIGALLDGAYEGDVSFAQLAEHGDLGLGTLNALDGEMIALDGRFYRADLDGAINEIEPGTDAVRGRRLVRAGDRVRARRPARPRRPRRRPRPAAAGGASSCAVRWTASSTRSGRARSHARNRPTAARRGDRRPACFRASRGGGTVVGFRFPDYAEGLEVSGYHLHFISEDRSRGGHLLECSPTRAGWESIPRRTSTSSCSRDRPGQRRDRGIDQEVLRRAERDA